MIIITDIGFLGLACLAVSKFSVGVEWLLDGLSEYLQFT